jgi:hypothetical protein
MKDTAGLVPLAQDQLLASLRLQVQLVWEAEEDSIAASQTAKSSADGEEQRGR